MDKNKIFEIIKVILQTALPAIISGIVSISISSRNVKKNISEKKMQLAYSHVYYKLYLILRDNYNKAPDNLFPVMDELLLKYDIYISPMTRTSYLSLVKQCKTTSKDKYIKSYYKAFRSTVLSQCNTLRNGLGYPTSSFIETYKSLPTMGQRSIKCLIACLIMYAFLFIFEIFKNDYLTIGIIIPFIYIIYSVCSLSWLDWQTRMLERKTKKAKKSKKGKK